MNVAVVGSRTWDDSIFIFNTLDELLFELDVPITIVSGGAEGADKMGEAWTIENGMSTIIHLPDWKKYGKPAGYRRNELIVRDAGLVLAFQRDSSKGTQHTIDIARREGVEVRVFEYTNR